MIPSLSSTFSGNFPVEPRCMKIAGSRSATSSSSWVPQSPLPASDSPAAAVRNPTSFLSPRAWNTRFRASFSTTRPRCRPVTAPSRSSLRHLMGVRPSWKETHCIRSAMAAQIPSPKRPFLIFTIRIAPKKSPTKALTPMPQPSMPICRASIKLAARA